MIGDGLEIKITQMPSEPAVLRQNHASRVIWDFFILLLSLWEGYYVPLDITFGEEIFDQEKMSSFQNAIDILFCVDILINFRTTYFS